VDLLKHVVVSLLVKLERKEKMENLDYEKLQHSMSFVTASGKNINCYHGYLLKM